MSLTLADIRQDVLTQQTEDELLKDPLEEVFQREQNLGAPAYKREMEASGRLCQIGL